jgi:hypothetical protein
MERYAGDLTGEPYWTANLDGKDTVVQKLSGSHQTSIGKKEQLVF